MWILILSKAKSAPSSGPMALAKPTFVSLLSGRVTATAGSVEFRGQDITGLPIHKRVRKGIAYTFQITSIFPNLTVLENAAIAAQNRCQPEAISADIRHDADLALQQVGIAHLKDEPAGTIAYGQSTLARSGHGVGVESSAADL